METIKLMENRMASIFYSNDKEIAILNLLGDLSSTSVDIYKNTFKQFLHFVIESGAKSIIVDYTKSEAGSTEQRRWLVSAWMPMLIEKVKNPDFKIIGINDVQVGCKRFVADFMKATLKRLSNFKVVESQTFEDAMVYSLNN